MEKERLDVVLVKRNLIDTREKAKRMIMAGLVFTNQERLDKPGMKVKTDIPITIKGKMPYVSRGGFKLEKALSVFNTSIKDKVVADIGSSTGGFTDCALQNGAKLIYAIDVGYNQLDWKLRNDDRVIVKERTNFRYVSDELFSAGMPNYATIDVSFISLKLILPVLKQYLQLHSEVIALIKPQFEAEKNQVGKKGVIRDKKIHKQVIQRVFHFAKEEGYSLLDLTFSPIAGGEGNIEYLVHLGWQSNHIAAMITDDTMIHKVVEQAHESVKKNKR